MCLEVMPALIFCSLAIILTCLAIFQVRRERTELHIRITKIEKLISEIEHKTNIGR